ncbi:hypothetical protein LO762_28615 [Actinocorallia sp. API 0066]|uniref:hypothetical protein n=1 Tax=Actinocorallia sp. API 0066 TaxID=2896846 RepID=UPI001E330023|nr:hypothetical protein [Actinocorallia sp. API 0066]MCD0453115.1 hypothetical protein [Actinocorallia sp. API 0066]
MPKVTFTPGEQVVVPCGRGIRDGVVIETFGRGRERLVAVSVDYGDGDYDDYQRVPFRPGELLMAAAEVGWRSRTAFWEQPDTYLHAVQHALNHVLLIDFEDSFERAAELTGRPGVELRLVIRDVTVLVQVLDVEGSAEHRAPDVPEEDAGAPVLVVSRIPLTPEKRREIRAAVPGDVQVRAVEWRSRADNGRLGGALRELVEG